MKSALLLTISCLFMVNLTAKAQSSTTESLYRKHSGALTLFFYNNTLRMLNQSEDKEFDELIRDIEKMRFLLIRKSDARFGGDDYKRLLSDYKSEKFEEIMTSRHDGKNFDVYLKEQGGKTSGMLVLVNDDENLYVLDILGRIALDKITKFYDKLDESSDIGNKIRQFTDNNRDDDSDDDNK